jgi:hypothetical protein
VTSIASMGKFSVLMKMFLFTLCEQVTDLFCGEDLYMSYEQKDFYVRAHRKPYAQSKNMHDALLMLGIADAWYCKTL